MLLLLDELGELLPLLGGGVDTGGVVGTGMEENDRSLGHGLDVLLHGLKVETNSLGVKVAVLLCLEAGTLGDGVVVAPGGVGDVDGLAGVVLGKELHADAEGTGSREGLSVRELVHQYRVNVGVLTRFSLMGAESAP